MRICAVAIAIAAALARPSLAAAVDPGPAALRLGLAAHTDALGYQSPARTAGGIGGGLGLRLTLNQLWLAQLDGRYLFGLGDVVQLQLAAGVQWPGVYAPALLLVTGVLLGEQLTFLAPATPMRVTTPPVLAGLLLAPCRFQLDGYTVSLLQLGLLVGHDLAYPGLGFELQFLEVAVDF